MRNSEPGLPYYYKDAMNPPACDKWKEAMNLEFKSLQERGVMELVDDPMLWF